MNDLLLNVNLKTLNWLKKGSQFKNINVLI